MNTGTVDSYLQDGCGRCDLYRTPNCKVLRWTPALVQLRELALASGLTEELKWGSPCYTLEGKNVAMIVAFKESCALQFFKGAAMSDPDGLLERPGPNSQYGRFVRFLANEHVAPKRPQLLKLLEQAIALERAGVQVEPKAEREPLPEELEQRLAADPKLAEAFQALTPGRQRSHVLHISGAKQSETRARRVDRCVPEILAGRGFFER
ncbi:MAG: YdeI/OmpD-associated family protein [Deltaproteobacteria bacterium]|nr:YdeI/OmpD-associated family protein [Deltaproteobacteria bacterium]